MANIKVIVTDEANECDGCGKHIPPKQPYIELLLITGDYVILCTECVSIMSELVEHVKYEDRR